MFMYVYIHHTSICVCGCCDLKVSSRNEHGIKTLQVPFIFYTILHDLQLIALYAFFTESDRHRHSPVLSYYIFYGYLEYVFFRVDKSSRNSLFKITHLHAINVSVKGGLP